MHAHSLRRLHRLRSGFRTLAIAATLWSGSANAEARLERVAWLADGRVLALVDGDGRRLQPDSMRLYHDGIRIDSFQLAPAEDGLLRLEYRAPRSLGPAIHHAMVLSGGGLDPTRPITAEMIEGQELDPRGLDLWGEARPARDWLERSAVAIGAVLLALGLYAFYRWLEERSRPPTRVCRNCGEAIEAGFKVCVYCTYPGLMAGRNRGASQAKGVAAMPHNSEDEPEVPAALQDTVMLERLPALQVVDGAETGRRYTLRSEEVFIGRSRTLDVVLADPSVALRHARLVHSAADFRIEDLSGGLGVKVNGRPLRTGIVTFGDRMTVGGTTLLLLPD